jgi:LPXTG-site transpeptidase (sortase) family protein
MSIPSIGLVAPLVAMGVRDGYMDLPNSPHDVAWYQFTSKPGMGGNAVFSAHVDYINYGPAVFWNLAKVRPGDGVLIRLRDGSIVRYVVESLDEVSLAQLDVAATIAPTEQESITLITCSGEFAANNYSHRIIVHAVRVGAARSSS